MASFDDRKREVLEGLASDAKDKSRAGGVDAPIASLINRINLHPQYFTTSSCSGRISIFSESAPDDGAKNVECYTGKKTSKKKGGDWVYVSHDPGLESEVLKCVQEYITTMEDGLLVFRYEPFILAVECRTPAAAQTLVQCAVSAGFRESGISGMGKRNIVGVRCSIRLEVPIVLAGNMLVTEDYLRFLTALANRKMELNRQRTDTFSVKFMDQIASPELQKLSEFKCAMSRQEPSSELPPSELSLYNESEEVSYASGNQDQAEKNFAIDKESKKKLSALKGRQLRLLARLNTFEDQRLLSTGAISAGKTEQNARSSRKDGSVCSSVHAVKDLTTQAKTTSSVYGANSKSDSASLQSDNGSRDTEARLSASNGRRKSDGCSLSAAHLEVRGEPIERLHCWSHSAVQIEINGHHSLLLYGGFGGPDRHARLGNSMVLDCVTGELKCYETSHAPQPRMSHVAVVVSQSMVVIGGRHDPSTCLGDVCVLDLKTSSWHFPEVTGSHFLPRHRHAAARVGDNIYVFGGMNQDSVLGDFYVLNTSSWKWNCVNSRGDTPAPRYSHSLAAIGQKLYLFGGRDAKISYGDLHVFCLETNTWTEQKGLGELSIPRFSHSMTAIDKWLVILGGCPITHHGTDLLFFNVDEMISQRVPLTQASLDVLLVRHTATLLGTRLVVVGGGAACFAFGAKFNVPFLVDLVPYLNRNTSAILTDGVAGFYSTREESSIDRDSSMKGGPSDEFEKRAWILKLDRNNAKTGKDALKQLEWLDQTRKPKVLDGGLHVAFPITEDAALYLQEPGSKGTSLPTRKGLNMESSQKVISNLIASGGEVVEMQLALDTRRPISPSVTLEAGVVKLLQEAGLPQDLIEELPKKYVSCPQDDLVISWRCFSNSATQ